MVTLYSMLWVSAAFFAILGMIRGLRREVVALAGIVLASFALFQFDALLRGLLLATIPRDQACLIQLLIFGAILYFSYQTRTFGNLEDDKTPRNNRTQDAILGGLLGGVNGYMIWGMVWYLLDINDYPFSPLISAPAPNSISAQTLSSIPLVTLGSVTGTGSEGFIVLVIIMFVLVLFII